MKNNKILILDIIMLIIIVGFGIWMKTSVNDNMNEVLSYIKSDGSENGCINIIYRSQYLIDEEEEKTKCIVDETINKYDDSEEILSLSEEELIKLYQKDDYEFEKKDENKIFFIRNYGKYKYEPNKYVIGINDDYITIYKTDKEGKRFIENPEKDITDICTDNLPEDDIIYLESGSAEYEFNSRDEAEEGVNAMFKS